MTLIEQMRIARESLEAKGNELATLSAKEDYTPDDDARCKVLNAEITKDRADYEQLVSRNANAELGGTLEKFLASHETPNPVPIAGGAETLQGQKPESKVLLPATYSGVRLKNIKGEKFGLSAEKRAYDFGQWGLAVLQGNHKAIDYCQKNNLYTLSYFEGNNAKGGILVPTEISLDIIDLRDTYGLFRQLAKIKPMTSDHFEGKIRKGGLEAYPATEGETVDYSDGEYGEIELTARKWLVFTDCSTELTEDTFIEWADEMVGEIARAFAKKEDQCGFFGDGTSAYHKITGIIPKLKAMDDTVANITPLQVASGNAWSEITLNDLIQVTGRVRSMYAQNDDLVWICSNQFYTNVMQTLAMATGGTSATQVVNGIERQVFMGRPVIFANNFPVVEANSQIPVLYGSVRQAAILGDRKGVAVVGSDQAKFESDMLVWRGRERFDIDVWNLGNAAVPADRVNEDFGPLAGLIMAAS